VSADLSEKRPLQWLPLVVAIAATCAVAGIGRLLTELGPWYFALKKPWWQPPDWAFGPAWTIIFAFATAAAYKAWTATRDSAFRTRVVLLFLLNGALNVTWSWLFFTQRRPDWALVEVAIFWLSILALMIITARRARAAAYLLLPYLAWVSFAACLNQTVAALNAPFG